MTRLITLALALLLLSSPALAVTPIVADISNYRIDIDSGFNGTRIFLFGARNDSGDVVIVVRGPSKDYIVRKKEQIMGIWVNRSRMKFFDVPDFYAVASSKKLEDIMQTGAFNHLRIGQDNLFTPPSDPKQLIAFNEFSDAFLHYQHERKLYKQDPEPVSFMGETLFKTVIEFPDDIPPGNYTAEIYLLSGGQVVGMQSTPIHVVKSGLDAFLYMWAHSYPTLYGLAAVLMALTIGWFAGRIFEKI